jgi:IMP dehydrogenase
MIIFFAFLRMKKYQIFLEILWHFFISYSMVSLHQPNELDSQFFRGADDFFPAHSSLGLTYDDVSLATLYSEVLPRDTQLDTQLAEGIELHIPVVSADMDTVTESRMAINMALNGGLGLIHYNMSEKDQLAEVARVKGHVHGLIQDPVTISPDKLIGDLLQTIEKEKYTFSTFPVLDKEGKLLGVLPAHVLNARFAKLRVIDVTIPRSQVCTILQSDLGKDAITAADDYFTKNPMEHKLIVVDSKDRLCGLFTLSDILKINQERRAQFKAARDSRFRLLCGAAISIIRDALGRMDRKRMLAHISALIDRGVDVIAVSTAHGHSRDVGAAVKTIRDAFPTLPIIAGNVTSGAGVDFLAESGANVIKVGQGPGSICTTRIVAGVGIPQLTALYVAFKAAEKRNVTILADGGINKSGDIVKALTLSHAVVCGGLLAGCHEAPGEIIEIGGKLYKQYRGMGSLAAMRSGSASRYGHLKADTTRKVAAEGIEALKEISGSLDNVLSQLIGGIQSGMGYLGAQALPDLRQKARFIQISPAGQREAAPHDVVELKTAAK